MSVAVLPTALLLLSILPIKLYLKQWKKTKWSSHSGVCNLSICVGLNLDRQPKQRCAQFYQCLFWSSVYPPYLSFRILFPSWPPLLFSYSLSNLSSFFPFLYEFFSACPLYMLLTLTPSHWLYSVSHFSLWLSML